LAGELIIAVHRGLGARQPPKASGQLRSRHPKLQVTLHEKPAPADMERLLRQGNLDMVLAHRVPAGCTFDVHPLGEEAYVAVLPKGHPVLADGTTLRLEDLASEGWIRFRRTSLLDEYLAHLLADASLSPAHGGTSVTDHHCGAPRGAGLGRQCASRLSHPRRLRRTGPAADARPHRPVLLGVRRNRGLAETVMLDHLSQQNWCGTGLICQPATG
jgi:DNA-binding transcriptional LysR family regulator